MTTEPTVPSPSSPPPPSPSAAEAASEAESQALRESGLLSPKKLAIQLVGFVVGLGLLAWCILGAVRGGDWTKLRDADPLLVAAMLGCTLASVFLNGAMFWVAIRPVQPIRFWDLQRLNVVGNLLNYAPVRLGAIARVFYHVRVDGLGLLQVGAWFAVLGYLLALAVGSCLLATLARASVDGIWLLLVVGQLALGLFLTQALVGNRFVARYGQGVDRMLSDHTSLWGGAALRMVDLSAYAGRMAIALTILDIAMPAGHIVVLAVVAIAASLIPFGRLGFREFAVAVTAERLSMLESDIATNMDQLALVESAGEALVFIPLGAAALLWYRRKWREAAPDRRPADAAA